MVLNRPHQPLPPLKRHYSFSHTTTPLTTTTKTIIPRTPFNPSPTPPIPNSLPPPFPTSPPPPHFQLPPPPIPTEAPQVQISPPDRKVYDTVPRTDDVFNLKISDLVLDAELGHGNFGSVRLGHYNHNSKMVPVAVKTLKSSDISAEVGLRVWRWLLVKRLLAVGVWGDCWLWGCREIAGCGGVQVEKARGLVG